MKLIKKIKAFFIRQNEPMELDLVAAEIKEGKAYLHPRGEQNVTYLVRSDEIEITLSKGRTLGSKDIVTIDETTSKSEQERGKERNRKKERDRERDQRETAVNNNLHNDLERFKKRKFVVSLYPEEYETLMSSMKEYGYKRADFVMACVNTATKGTMEKAHKKIVKSHDELKKEQKSLQESKETTMTY